MIGIEVGGEHAHWGRWVAESPPILCEDSQSHCTAVLPRLLCSVRLLDRVKYEMVLSNLYGRKRKLMRQAWLGHRHSRLASIIGGGAMFFFCREPQLVDEARAGDLLAHQGEIRCVFNGAWE